MKLEGKRIILTGAASGIGRGVLDLLAKIDCAVVAVDLATEGIATAKNVTPYACDLSQKKNVDALFEFALKTMGGVDVFIANAGFAYYEEIERADWDRLERIYRVNALSPIYAAEKMKELNRDRAYSVVVTSSAMAFLSLPGYAIYSGTKAAVRGFADAYRYELKKGQRLQVVFPIATRTNFFREAGGSPVPFPSMGVERVARSIVRGIERGRNSIHPSILFRTMLAVHRVFPAALALERWIEYRRFRSWLSAKRG